MAMHTRSAKSAASAKIKKALAENDTDMDSDNHDDAHEISDDTDEEEVDVRKNTKNRRKSTSRVAPPAKKAKTSSESPQKLSVVSRTSRRRSLSVLVTMPLDILFEVFGHLAPKDLISLSRTTKTLRSTLLGKSAKSVWITSRSREGAPDPPTDMSEPQWAALIFGHTCMGCKTTNIHTIDFLIRRRVCTSCKKRNLLVRHRVRKEFEDIDESVLDYISPTNIGGWAHGHASNSQFYWKSDIEDMLHTLAKYEADVRSRKKGAKQALEDFKAKRIDVVKKTREDARTYKDWVSTTALDKQRGVHQAQEKRKEEILRRFLELGYTKADVASCDFKFYEEFKKKGEINERVWTRLRPRMEPHIMRAKQSRRESEDRAVRQSRRQILDRLFKAYKMTLPPAQWKYLPTTAILSGLQPFRDIIEADASTVVTEADLKSCMENIAEILTAATDALKTRLIERAAASHRSPSDSTGTSAGGGTQLEPPQIFELATSVFDCGSCRKTVYGWNEITSHFCSAGDKGLLDASHYYVHTTIYDTEYPYEFSFNTGRAGAVRAVIKAAGLDPATATAAEMDAKDLRFTCVRCDNSPSYHYLSNRKHRAYSWRGSVEHIGTHYELYDSTLAVLSPEITATVKHQETLLTCGLLSKWASTRCDAFLTKPSSFGLVKQHLQDVHHIARPQEGVDLIHLPRARVEHEVKYITAEQNQTQITNKQSAPSGGGGVKGVFKWPVKCQHCQSSNAASVRDRLFHLEGVRSHIQAKHRINAAAKDVDYLVVAKTDIPQSWKDKFRPAPDDLLPPS